MNDSMKALEEMVYWLIVIVGVASSIVAAAVIMPMLIVLKTGAAYFFIALIGLVMGLLFEIIIRDMEYLEKKHHVIILFTIPIFSLVNFLVIFGSISYYPIIFGNNFGYDPWLVGLLYNVPFLLPYLVYQFFWKDEKK